MKSRGYARFKGHYNSLNFEQSAKSAVLFEPENAQLRGLLFQSINAPQYRLCSQYFLSGLLMILMKIQPRLSHNKLALNFAQLQRFPNSHLISSFMKSKSQNKQSNRNQPPTMSRNPAAKTVFSLDQSYRTFDQLRQRLRKMTATLPQNEERENKKVVRIQLQDEKMDVITMSTEAPSKQLKPIKLTVQETQRKKSRNDQKAQEEITQQRDKNLLWKKQNTLNEINRLLDLKKQYLMQIEQQLNKDCAHLKLSTCRIRGQENQQTATKVKAPDLYQIRQERRKLSQNRQTLPT